MFDSNKYVFDEPGGFTVRLDDGALLYRITDMTYSASDVVMSGRGPIKTRGEGRWHVVQQPATYCSDNILVCVSEVLFHMYRGLLDNLSKNKHPREVLDKCTLRRVLAIVQTKEISGLINIESKYLNKRHASATRIQGAVAVHPDVTYEPFRVLNEELRRDAQVRGVVYPSARHSSGMCFVFFEDESKNVKADTVTLELQLCLIPESYSCGPACPIIDPYENRVCGYAGYYQCDKNALEDLRRKGMLNPANMPHAGVVSFLRRLYSRYPEDAVVSAIPSPTM